MNEASHFTLYVADQERSTAFYEATLALAPRLPVPGMTEFELPGGSVLGLMPEQGIRKLLEPSLPAPALARAAPRCEVYLLIDDPAACHSRALLADARELSPLSRRDWVHSVAYSLDPDGHVLRLHPIRDLRTARPERRLAGQVEPARLRQSRSESR